MLIASSLEVAARDKVTAEGAETAAFLAKSGALKQAIPTANEKFPHHAPVYNSIAFETRAGPVTLDCLLLSALSKTRREGVPHVLETILSTDDKWSETQLMFEAYGDMIKQQR